MLEKFDRTLKTVKMCWQGGQKLVKKIYIIYGCSPTLGGEKYLRFCSGIKLCLNKLVQNS